jgi:hypothetical protein
MGAVVAVIGVGWYHRHSMQTQSRAEAERRRFEDAAIDAQGQIQTARQETAALAREMAASRPPGAAGATDAALASPAPKPKPPAARASPELREMQVRAFVSEQRLRFAATLKRLAPDARKPGEFDRIQGECQRTLLDESQTDAGRQQARQTRDARLKELFGPDYEQWAEANRSDPARALVAEIVHRTFQSSGALTTTQADELTRIVGVHRVSPGKAAGGGQAHYDWDAIVAEAGTVLDPLQQDDFATAVRLRRASDEMSALAAPKK